MQGKHMHKYKHIRRMDEREQWFIKAGTKVMNKEILECKVNVVHWNLMMEKEKGEPRKIRAVKFENYYHQIVTSKFANKLIEKCIAREAK